MSHRNIEVKAYLENADFIREVLTSNGVKWSGNLDQRDTYFKAVTGRLKLRQIPPNTNELISYDREDEKETKLSRYSVVHFSDSQAILDLLSHALGIDGVVIKKRELWLLGKHRFHFDQVEGLGAFFEMEFVIDDQIDEETCRQLAREWTARLKIKPSLLIQKSYIDLLHAIESKPS